VPLVPRVWGALGRVAEYAQQARHVRREERVGEEGVWELWAGAMKWGAGGAQRVMVGSKLVVRLPRAEQPVWRPGPAGARGAWEWRRVLHLLRVVRALRGALGALLRAQQV
jgi:hypothetical protein